MSFSFLIVFYVILVSIVQSLLIFWKLASSSFLAMFCATLCVVNETTIVSLKTYIIFIFHCVLYLCHCDFHCDFHIHCSRFVFFFTIILFHFFLNFIMFCVLLAKSHCRIVHHHHYEVNKSCPICIMFEILIQAHDLLIVHLNSLCKWLTITFWVWRQRIDLFFKWWMIWSSIIIGQIMCMMFLWIENLVIGWKLHQKLGIPKFLCFNMLIKDELNIFRSTNCGTIDKNIKTWNGKDKKFKCAMPMGIRVVCSLYKLTHAYKYL